MTADDEDQDDSNSQRNKTESDDTDSDCDLIGGDALVWESEDLSPELREQFLESIAQYENAPWITYLEMLGRAGIEMPAPETLDDQELTSSLWNAIHALAEMNVFIGQTNHLSDRELYTLMLEDMLREETKDVYSDGSGFQQIDVLGGCSEEQMVLYHRFYASEESRKEWSERWPDDVMPDHEDPPYDRDRLLPAASSFSPDSDDEWEM